MTATNGLRALVAGCALLSACASRQAAIPVDTGTAAPGAAVMLKGAPVRLFGAPITVGSPLPATALVEAGTMRIVDLSRERGKTLFLSIVVSIDTAT